MTKGERERMSAVMEAAEYLFLENLALKLVMEHSAIPNWQKLIEKLMADQEILAGVHLKFKDLDWKLERSVGPSTALEALLGTPKRPKKPH